MNKPLISITFFTIALFAFGISALNFEDLSFAQNTKGYVAIAGGVILALIYVRSKRKEN